MAVGLGRTALEAELQDRPEIPKAGTYVATAQFAGADPVHLRMFLHK